MIFFYNKLLARLRFVILFCTLTFVLYQLLLLLTNWSMPSDKYRQPSGKATKVFHHHTVLSESGTIADRLRLFYWYGE